VADLASGLRSAGFDDPDFRASNYMRLKVLSQLREKNAVTEDLFWRRP
jgi:hypothetical protein